MLAARLNGNSVTFMGTNSIWTDGTVLNSGNAPTDSLDIKTYAWYSNNIYIYICICICVCVFVYMRIIPLTYYTIKIV